MKKIWLVLLFLTLIVCSCSGNKGKNETTPIKLETPVVEISDDGLATWNAITGAINYAYSINSTNFVETNNLSVQLVDKDNIVVKAIGDGVEYLDSDLSVVKTYILSVKLSAPVVTISNTGLASWEAVSGASKYAYSINGQPLVETTSLSVQLADGDTITVKAIGDGVEYLDSDNSNVETYIKPVPLKLATPLVSISNNGVASWEAVSGAINYIYSINESNGIATVELSVQLYAGDSIKVMAVSNGIDYVNSDYSSEVVFEVTNTLTVPQVSISNSGLASWEAVLGAIKYAYSINGQTPVETTNLSVQLANGDRIKVMAIGDRINSVDSLYSSEITYTADEEHNPVKLDSPSVVVSSVGVASWGAVLGATKYIYSINDSNGVETTNLSVQLYDGDSIKVMAVGDGVDYVNSDYSSIVGYSALSLSKPSVSISSTGLASWESVDGAVKYVYIINNQTPVETTNLSVQLYDGDSIKVMAVGNGINYSKSDYSSELVYIAPVVLDVPEVDITITGVASWEVVSGAIKYAYSINGQVLVETTELSVQLADGDTIVVKAIGDGVTYLDSDLSDLMTYIEPVKLSAPTVTISNTGLASWSSVSGAIKYAYSINGQALVETTSLSVQLADGDTITVKAIGDGVTYLDSDFSTAKKYSASAGSYNDGETWGPLF